MDEQKPIHHQAQLEPSVSLAIETSEAPVPADTLEQARAAVQWPKWVSDGYIRAIKNLKCFEIVRRHCLDGIPSVEIARLIHSLGECPDIKLSTIESWLLHYRATLPKGELMVSRRLAPRSIEEKLKKRIEVRDDLEKLKNWMFERLEIAVNREKSFGMLIPNTEKSFAVALEIVSRIQEIQEKEIGNVEQQAGQQVVSWTRTDFDQMYQKPGMNDTLKNPVSRMKIARFLDQTMQLVGGMDEAKREQLLEVAKKQVEGESPSG